MHPNWNSFWTNESQFENLLVAFSPSPFQRRFLQQLKPFEVPALALELSKIGLRRRPTFEISILSNRLQRWDNTLKPLLRVDGTFASGLSIKDLQPFLHAQDLFFSETGFGMHEAPREHAGQSFELFRQTLKPIATKTFRKELEKIYSKMNSMMQKRLPLPSQDWWDAVESLPTEGGVQAGFYLTPTTSRWNLIFKTSKTKTLLEKLDFPKCLSSCLAEFPMTIGLDSRFSSDRQYELMIYPLKTSTNLTLEYNEELETDPFLWPAWPAHPNLLPTSRLNRIIMSTIYRPKVDYGGQNITIHGGMCRQKVLIKNGKICDHKACSKVSIKSSKIQVNQARQE